MPNNDPAALLQRHSSTKMCIMMENLQGWAAADATSSSSANKCHVRRDRNVLCITSEISAEAGDIGWACYLHVLTMEKNSPPNVNEGKSRTHPSVALYMLSVAAPGGFLFVRPTGTLKPTPNLISFTSN